MLPLFSDSFAASGPFPMASPLVSETSSSSSSSSSCDSSSSHNPLVIQRPSTVEVSFDWSDFLSIPPETSIDYNQSFPPAIDEASSSSTSSSEDEDDGLSSCSSLDCELASSSTSASTALDTTRPKKSVSFASDVDIRTYNVVLGDHPMCPSLAIELGWEFNEHCEENGLKSSLPRRQRRRLYRRSYLERKALLQTMTGMSSDELIERSHNMKPSKPSCRQLSALV